MSADGLVSEQEKAYFAGYTDAEGCIRISKIRAFSSSPAWTACVVFNQTCPVVIEQMCAIYGGTINIRKPKGGRCQKSWRVAAYDEVRRFLSDITPYLREKRAQATEVLWRFDPKQGPANDILIERISSLKRKRVEAVAVVTAKRDPARKCFDCALPAAARGYCGKHYQTALRAGRFRPHPVHEGVPFVHGRELTALEAPYFAGYFDGDGCLTFSRQGNCWYPRIVFGQTQPDAVCDLHSVYGGSLTFVERSAPQLKPFVSYQLGQRNAVVAMLRDIQPFVLEKREQVDLFLERFRSVMSVDEGRDLKNQLSSMKTKVFVKERET